MVKSQLAMLGLRVRFPVGAFLASCSWCIFFANCISRVNELQGCWEEAPRLFFFFLNSIPSCINKVRSERNVYFALGK